MWMLFFALQIVLPHWFIFSSKSLYLRSCDSWHTEGLPIDLFLFCFCVVFKRTDTGTNRGRASDSAPPASPHAPPPVNHHASSSVPPVLFTFFCSFRDNLTKPDCVDFTTTHLGVYNNVHQIDVIIWM